MFITRHVAQRRLSLASASFGSFHDIRAWAIQQSERDVADDLRTLHGARISDEQRKAAEVLMTKRYLSVPFVSSQPATREQVTTYEQLQRLCVSSYAHMDPLAGTMCSISSGTASTWINLPINRYADPFHLLRLIDASMIFSDQVTRLPFSPIQVVRAITSTYRIP